MALTTKFLYFIFFLCLALIARSEEKSVSIDFDPVPDALFYQIEISNSKSVIQKLNLKTTHVDVPLKIGSYKIRIRSYDKRKVPGPWSDYFEAVAAGPPPQLLTPETDKKILSIETEKMLVTFTWTPQEMASSYKIFIEPGSIQKEISTTSIQIEVPVATVYKWRILSMREKDLLYDDPEKWNVFTIYGKTLDTPIINELSTKYDETLRWSKPNYTKNYHVVIERDSTFSSWKKIYENKNYLESSFNIPKKYIGGSYRIKVKSKSELREDSEWSEYNFNLAEGLRGVVAAKKGELRDSLELPSTDYLIASYFISNIQYSGINKEINSETSYNALGGIGRIGIGHFKQNSPTGYFGILDLSGYNIGQQNFTYASSELHYCYRTYISTVQIRSSAGIYFKEIPETKGELDGSFSMNKIAVIGPHFGFDYWKPITTKYGIQINGRVYYSALSAKTPNGKPLESRLSYQAGVLGSYRFTSNIIAFAGYAFRADQGAYKSTPGTLDPDFTSVATEGDINSVNITGHYLNLQFEWGF